MLKYGYLLPTRGVVLSSDDETTLAAKAEAHVVGLAQRAEAMDFGSVWVGDSVLAKPRLEPLSTLATVAEATDAINLGTAVYLPTLRNPVHVAHMTATVDQLSGGRFGLGIGVGLGSDVEREYANLNIDFGTRGARMDELLEIVTGLWEGDSIDYDGEFFSLEDASIGFSPARKPPVYIPTLGFDPSDGFPRPIRNRLSAHGDGWMPAGISPETYAESLTRIRSFLFDADRDSEAFDPAYYIDIMIHEDEDVAINEAREFYDRYFPEWDRLSDAEIRSRGAFGPVENIATTLDAYDEAGVETMIVRFTARDQRDQLQRFADLVR